MTAKPAGEPRWIPEDVRDLLNAASKHSRNLGEYWNKVTDALNTASTRAAQPLTTDNQRMWDLLRYQRSDLLQANLITMDEYDALAQDHAAVKRLEDYDALRLAAQPGDAPKLTALSAWWRSKAFDAKYINDKRPTEQICADELDALLASRSTPAAPAPAKAEAPGAPDAIMASDRNLAIDLLCMYDDTISTEELTKRLAGRISEIRRSALAAPGTEALIAAGDARERPICKWCVEDASPPEWSAHAKVWIHRRERLDKQCLNPPTALAELLREAAWWRHLTFHHQESYFAIEGDKRIASLRAALAELERPGDVPSAEEREP